MDNIKNINTDEMKIADGFNGGKMFHIFGIKDGAYTGEFSSTGAQDAFEYGDVFHKVDGSNGAIELIDGVYTLLTRFDDKKGRVDATDPTYKTLKVGNVSEYESDNGRKKVSHHYFLKKVVRPVPNESGKDAKIRREMYRVLDLAIEGGNETLSLMREGDRVSCEIIGKKFNKTPGVDEDVNIAIHCEQTVYFPERSISSVRDFLSINNCEGLIFNLGGICYKVRSNLLFPNCRFGKTSEGLLPIVKLAN